MVNKDDRISYTSKNLVINKKILDLPGEVEDLLIVDNFVIIKMDYSLLSDNNEIINENIWCFTIEGSFIWKSPALHTVLERNELLENQISRMEKWWRNYTEEEKEKCIKMWSSSYHSSYFYMRQSEINNLFLEIYNTFGFGLVIEIPTGKVINRFKRDLR